MIRKRWAVVALAGAIGLVLGAASMVLAGATVITAQANSLAVIKTISVVDEPSASTSSTSFVDVPGLARNATSTGTSNLFVGELTAGVNTVTSNISTRCEVRIAVKDNAASTVGFMNPAFGVSFHTSAEATGERHIERSISGLAPATYTFQVQFRVQGDPGTCHLFDIHFTLARYT